MGPPGLLGWLRVNLREFEPERLFMLSVYLLVMGLLLGYLAEQQKHLRAEKAVLTGTLSRVRVEAGLTGTIEQIFHEAMSMYGASRVVVASQESHSQRVFLGELEKASGRVPSEFRWLESGPRDARTYLDDFPGEVCYAAIDGDRVEERWRWMKAAIRWRWRTWRHFLNCVQVQSFRLADHSRVFVWE